MLADRRAASHVMSRVETLREYESGDLSMDRISSRQNAIVKHFREVAHGNADDLMLLDGDHLISEALASGIQFEVTAVAGSSVPIAS